MQFFSTFLADCLANLINLSGVGKQSSLTNVLEFRIVERLSSGQKHPATGWGK